MDHRVSTRWLAAASLCAALGIIPTGCASLSNLFAGAGNRVTVRNESDAAVNVAFFVRNPNMKDADPDVFVGADVVQVNPGAAKQHSLTNNARWRHQGDEVVHVRVQPVSPTWEPDGPQYWLELLTAPPVTIVASGDAGHMTFTTSEGQVAVIPPQHIGSDRFVHRMAEATADAP